MIYDIGIIGNKVYDYVDLDLPSGTKWATKNVSAIKPSDPGMYFQWGDTKGYTKDQVGKDKQFTRDDYKWFDEDRKTFTKYTNPGDKLKLKDDAAHVYMGGSWHIPSPEQIQELIHNTTVTWKVQNDGVEGIKFTSRNGKSLFIPAVGYALGGRVNNNGKYGYVWSSMLNPFYVRYVKLLYFNSNYANLDNGGYRCSGYSVRGVIG